MNHYDINYQPLDKVAQGLASDEGLSLEEIKADLVKKGYDPAALVSRLEARVRELSKGSRLAWVKEGEAAQAKLDTVLSHLKSWTQRSVAEVNQAFDDVRSGRYGSQAQLRVQTAFKNVTELPPESKAAFLDEVDALLALQKPSNEPKSE
jgi:hypothetical protein